jgi:hypothetical protein
VALVVAALAAAPPNLTRALEEQKRLAVQRPQDAAVFNDLGNLFLLARQPDEAEKAYRKSVELDPKRTSALFNLGLLHQQRGENRQALDLYRQVLELQPGHAWAHYQLGALYEAGGQATKAINEYAHAFALDPQLAFPEVNPHIVDSKLVTPAMLKAYREGYGQTQAPAVYEDPRRIADLLVTPTPAEPGKEAATPAPPGVAQPKPQAAQPGATVIRPGDLDNRVTGQAAPQGSVRSGRPISGPRMPTSVPRGTREWERPQPTMIQDPEGAGAQQQVQPMPAPGQVVTPPPGGVYYRPGFQSSGRLNLQVVPEKRVARG